LLPDLFGHWLADVQVAEATNGAGPPARSGTARSGTARSGRPQAACASGSCEPEVLQRISRCGRPDVSRTVTQCMTGLAVACSVVVVSMSFMCHLLFIWSSLYIL
ncbi:hypothetical protein, partial [Kineococcus sp. NPDC059986]|uniref:hypothetical protein n=1 Tax=Kineococcus sp. NPDC059986 TaxID=3155538 RepID=UPI00344F3A92